MKKIIIILMLFVVLIKSGQVVAGVCDGLSKDDCAKKITELENQVKQLSQQSQSLSNQVKYMDSQITLTTAKINNTENNIKTTEKEIGELTGKINRLDQSLNFLSKILVYKIAEGYKSRTVSVFDMFLAPKNASSLLKNLKYIQTSQNNDHLVAVKVERTKLSFEEQKTLREEKKQELEQLKKTLNNQSDNLNIQKGQKQTLLTQTNNDEKKYKQMLETALAEYQAIQGAINSGVAVGPVKKGDPIAIMGNTGYPYCSTGPHLHFEVRKDDVWVNPRDYLGNKFDWPMSEPIEITQEYGQTPWSWRYSYSGGIHTGIDMVGKNSDVIRAVADGTLYSSTQKCSSATINIKYIEHGEGLVSFYLHIK